MITNLLITGEHKIQVNKHGKILIGENKISIKEIPFIRFRPEELGEGTVTYFRGLKDKFNHSCHILEMEVSEESMKVLGELSNIAEESNIVFMYIPVNDKDLEDGIPTEAISMLNECMGLANISRVMIKDNSTALHAVQYNELKNQIAKGTGMKYKDIGVCGSPLSFGEEACLTAVIAREIIAMYGENDEYPLPSSKHESMNECGCIRHIVVDKDIIGIDFEKEQKNNRTIKTAGNKSGGVKVMKKFKH